MGSWARMAAGFTGPEHRSLWYAGDRQAAVLVHGFPGTPAELRPLADALHRAGWTVRAPLLPGFGAGLATLGDRTRAEWVEAVLAEWRTLSEHHTPLLLVGDGLGAAIALEVAAQVRIPALALIAPMQRLVSPWLHATGPLMRVIKRQVHPFRHLPVAWADAAVPARLVDELIRLSREATAAAPLHLGASLVVQPRHDLLSSRADTLRLAATLSGPVQFVETDGGHDELFRALTRFAWDAWEPVSDLRLPQYG